VIVGRVGAAAQPVDAAADPERFLVVTNWFEALLERVGN
jgi:hypothetical protein